MSNQSPQELFPNLFGAKVAKRAPEAVKPQDMRLLQYCMRQASKTPPRLMAAPAARRPAMAARATR